MKLTPDQKRRIVERFMAGESIQSIELEFWRADALGYGHRDARHAVESAIRRHIRAGRKRARMTRKSKRSTGGGMHG